ncbi:ribonuclease Y [candidate division WWE3 bacterium RIFCSPHIGHO2_01_FULL_40_23]|uniref:Ribonuclease Y n=1 Tax=candidate division WWE3 bacterium RIFCSPLOWO2_01_FULL_41_18 TaxID=1802625 RepID=A0A1F4VCW2_UNCKA|nr:MAG: ribonuclease Y [candidate division WWE3 bacterium RIFCSPHIGHO2_01_FULL_40_23]OGC55086.1 MAG: ribonuclease Y [candidate division WWE3 bacterium RIFCSPLOWO2_01_FULL_41_18]
MTPIEFVLVLITLGSVGGMFYLAQKGKVSYKRPEGKAGLDAGEIKERADLSDNQLVLEAQTAAKEIKLEARDEALKIKRQAEDEVRKVREETLELEKKLDQRQDVVERKISEVDKREQELNTKDAKVTAKLSDLDEVYKDQINKLQSIAGLTREEAKKELLSSLERELTQEVGKRIREAEEKIKQEADVKAKEILIDSMRHASTDYVVEYTVSKVKLPDEDMKGRIIGKEGRNIKVFEELTGVNLDMDESVSEVRISSFDPIRREIARVSLERLIADGRIQPAKIEEIVEKTKKDIDHIIFKEGEDLCHRVGVYNLPRDLIYMLGKFKYRFSYGQNMISHTLEETKLGVQIAHEVGADVNVVKLGCLFHDIGKIVTDEEGTHVQLGVDLLRKYKIPDAVVNCVAEHHEDKPFSSIESVVVHIADSISGARPGARSEDYEAYVKRMKDLEEASSSFDGVEKVYAISAGREVRVFVKPERVDDASCALLAREIAKKIELEQTYPGTVKVTVIRETRVSDTAK